MRILVVSIVDLEKSAPQRPHHFIKYFAQHHDVTVLCINDSWKNVASAKYHLKENEYLKGVKVIHITDKKCSSIYQELFIRFLLDKNKLESYDVIYNYNTLISGRYIAKLLKIPMVYDIADDLPEMIASSPQIPTIIRPFGKMVGKYFLNRNISYAKVVDGTSIIFQNLYAIPTEKFITIPNGVNTTIFQPLEKMLTLQSKLGISDTDFVLGYVGVLREWVDFVPVYRALQELDGVKLLIVGEEGQLSENKNLVNSLGLTEKVIFAGTVPYELVPQYISVMDVCLIPFKKNLVSQNAIPLKLFEYMACDKPVISSYLDGVISVVNDNILYVETKEKYVEIIQTLRSNTNHQKNMRDFVIQNYDWMNLSRRLEQVLEDVI